MAECCILAVRAVAGTAGLLEFRIFGQKFILDRIEHIKEFFIDVVIVGDVFFIDFEARIAHFLHFVDHWLYGSVVQSFVVGVNVAVEL